MRPLLVLPLVVLLASCSGSSAPSATEFTDGTCRAAAPDVLALGAAAERLGDGPTIPADAKATLRSAQEALSTVAEAAEPAYKPALDALVQSTGAVRIRADGNSYETSLGKRMRSDYQAVLDACT